LRNEIEFYVSCLCLFVLPLSFMFWLAVDSMFGIRPDYQKIPLVVCQSVLALVCFLVMADVVRQTIWSAS